MAIQDGAKFPSPIELVQYHTRKVDGLLTTLQVPCARRAGQPPQGYRFITHEDMQAAMREAALLLGYQVRVWAQHNLPCLEEDSHVSPHRKCLLYAIGKLLLLLFLM